MGKILGIDFGKKRIGLAISDSQKVISFPLKTIEKREIFNFLESFLKTENIESIILGDSKTKKNEPNALMKDVKLFSEKIKSKFNIPVYFVDERFTSRIAFKIIIEFSNIR